MLFAAVVALALWPSAQHVMTSHYRMNPWKFFGWAMYCTAPPEPRINVWSLDGEHPLVLPALLSRVDGGLGALNKFTDLRRLWGRLYHPDELAQRIFAGNPDLPGFLVYVNTIWLSARDGMPMHTTEAFRCVRDKACDVFDHD